MPLGVRIKMKEESYQKMMELVYEPDKRLMFKHVNMIIKDLEAEGFKKGEIIQFFKRLFMEELE